MHREGQPHHLTTAASIWSTAAVGMAVGTGAWFLALGASVLIWIILAVIRIWSKSDSVDLSRLQPMYLLDPRDDWPHVRALVVRP